MTKQIKVIIDNIQKSHDKKFIEEVCDNILESLNDWNKEASKILFEKNKMTISEHIKNIYNEGELDKTSTIRNFLTVQNEGNRTVKNDFITAPSEVPDEVVKTIEEALSTNDKKDNYKINNPWFFGSKDKIYRGTVYIPITQNQNQAIIAAG